MPAVFREKIPEIAEPANENAGRRRRPRTAQAPRNNFYMALENDRENPAMVEYFAQARGP